MDAWDGAICFLEHPTMKKVAATSLKSGERREYLVPSPEAAVAYAKSTYGEQFDQVERAKVRGGIPMVWLRA